MRIAVIGATGGVGAHVTRLAVEQGHTVVAMARDPSKIKAEASEKRKMDLNDRDVALLADSIRGCDIVLSCIGNRRGEPSVVERGTMAIMAAMSKANVQRMAMVSSIGVGDSRLRTLLSDCTKAIRLVYLARRLSPLLIPPLACVLCTQNSSALASGAGFSLPYLPPSSARRRRT